MPAGPSCWRAPGCLRRTSTRSIEGGLDSATADQLVENVVGVYALPLGLGLNFRVNGQDYLVPMAVEEPSVIAAASNAARMVRDGGGFAAEADEPIMTAQVEIVGVTDPAAAARPHRAREPESCSRWPAHACPAWRIGRAAAPREVGSGR